MNDLWSFSQTTLMWQWIKVANTSEEGRRTLPVTGGFHQNNSIPATTRHSGKLQPRTWNLIISCPSAGFEYSIWSFDFALNSWAMLMTAKFARAVYGVPGQPSSSNSPGLTEYGAIDFLDDGSTMFLMGGWAANGANQRAFSNDIWAFNMTTNQWTFIRGSQLMVAVPSFGLKGIAGTANIPGGRARHSLLYDSARDNFLLFGGLPSQNLMPLMDCA
eukprot:Partr_v1_DN22933_c0_g1_i1_m42580 putative Inherit from NOG: hedgehog protein